MSLGFFAVVGAIFSLVVTILWLVIGWRAMRAHENLAESHSDAVRSLHRISETLAHREEGAKSRLDSVDPAKLPRFKE